MNFSNILYKHEAEIEEVVIIIHKPEREKKVLFRQ